MVYRHILVPIDGSDISFSAARHAASIAKKFNAKLSFISLVAEDPFNKADFYYSSSIMKEYFLQAYDNAQEALSQARQAVESIGVEPALKIINGEVSAQHIVSQAEDLGIDLIVIGSNGRKGFQKMILGSFAQDVLRATNLPVLVIKQ